MVLGSLDWVGLDWIGFVEMHWVGLFIVFESLSLVGLSLIEI